MSGDPQFVVVPVVAVRCPFCREPQQGAGDPAARAVLTAHVAAEHRADLDALWREINDTVEETTTDG